MDGPLIAIVGSYNPAREKELGLRFLEQTAQASEDLGRELAKQGYRIVVYSDNPYQMELDLVRGYLGQKDVVPGAIQVLALQQHGQPHFVEEATNEDKFDFRPDFNPDWEFSFYQSLSHVDGMLILGGGPSGLVAGLVIIGHRKPVVVCAAFGGAGEKIWSALRAQDYALTDADLAVMAQTRWSPALATRMVNLFASSARSSIGVSASGSTTRINASRPSVCRSCKRIRGSTGTPSSRRSSSVPQQRRGPLPWPSANAPVPWARSRSRSSHR